MDRRIQLFQVHISVHTWNRHLHWMPSWMRSQVTMKKKSNRCQTDIRKKHPNNKSNTANQSMVKNLAETASHKFSTCGTTFRLRISQSSSSVFSLPISPCAPFLGTHLSLRCISCMKLTGDKSAVGRASHWYSRRSQIRIPLKSLFFQASFQFLKLENLLWWSFFTFITQIVRQELCRTKNCNEVGKHLMGDQFAIFVRSRAT